VWLSLAETAPGGKVFRGFCSAMLMSEEGLSFEAVRLKILHGVGWDRLIRAPAVVVGVGFA